MDNVTALEAELKALHVRRDKALAEGDYDNAWSLYEDQLRLERSLSLALGQETAVRIDWEPAWDVGAPLPHLVASGTHAFLIYLAETPPDPTWDGSTIRVVTGQDAGEVAIVTFQGLASFKIGAPNDEVLHGHPLSGHGLGPYTAHEVHHSRWLELVRAINAVHPAYNAGHWDSMRHYLLTFHDETFECLAKEHRIETIRASLAQALTIVTARLF